VWFAVAHAVGFVLVFAGAEEVVVARMVAFAAFVAFDGVTGHRALVGNVA